MDTQTKRQDAWTKDEDMLLAETVLRYIREGNTQLEAFKKVAKELSRTSAACGFRWNANIRKQYEHAIKMAKEARKNKMLNNDWRSDDLTVESDSDPIEKAILLLQKMKGSQINEMSESDKAQLKQLEKENKLLKQSLNRYQEAWVEMGKIWNWVNEKNDVIE